jgi:hypothetical protein
MSKNGTAKKFGKKIILSVVGATHKKIWINWSFPHQVNIVRG